MKTYYLELTDTFGGESNYSWVRRFRITAFSDKQALTKFKREYFGKGHNQRHTLEWNSGDTKAFKFSGNCIIAFLEDFDEENHGRHTWQVL